EPNLNFVDAGPVDTTPSQVLITLTANTDYVMLTAMGKDKNCWNIAQLNQKVGNAPAGTYYSKTALNAAGTGCDAPGVPTAAGGPDSSNTAANGTVGTWYSAF